MRLAMNNTALFVPRLVSIMATALLMLTFAGCPQSLEENPEATQGGSKVEGFITIGSQKVAIEHADTPEKMSKGLGYRDSLAWGSGMYFSYPQAGLYRFWMKGMRFSIDIVWIRDDRIVDISADVPFELGGNGPTVQPREAANAVLEVPAGYAAAVGWRIGDRVRFERTATSS